MKSSPAPSLNIINTIFNKELHFILTQERWIDNLFTNIRFKHTDEYGYQHWCNDKSTLFLYAERINMICVSDKLVKDVMMKKFDLGSDEVLILLKNYFVKKLYYSAETIVN